MMAKTKALRPASERRQSLQNQIWELTKRKKCGKILFVVSPMLVWLSW